MLEPMSRKDNNVKILRNLPLVPCFHEFGYRFWLGVNCSKKNEQNDHEIANFKTRPTQLFLVIANGPLSLFLSSSFSIFHCAVNILLDCSFGPLIQGNYQSLLLRR